MKIPHVWVFVVYIPESPSRDPGTYTPRDSLTDHDSTRPHPIRDPPPRRGVASRRGRAVASIGRWIHSFGGGRRRRRHYELHRETCSPSTRRLFRCVADPIDRTPSLDASRRLSRPSLSHGGRLEIRPARTIDRWIGGVEARSVTTRSVTMGRWTRGGERERERTNGSLVDATSASTRVVSAPGG
jgi:hypothetical protein